MSMESSIVLDWLSAYGRNQRFRRIRNERIANTTEPYLSQYRERLESLRREGLDRFVQQDVDEIEALLNQAQALLDDRAEEARDLSFRIRDRLRGLGTVARFLRRDQAFRDRQAERERRTEAWRMEQARRRDLREGQMAFLKTVDEEIGKAFRDPVACDLVQKEIAELRLRFSNPPAENLESETVRFREAISRLSAEAAEKAAAWKASRKSERASEIAAEAVEDHVAAVQKAGLVADGERLQGLVSSLRNIGESIASGHESPEESLTRADGAIETTVREAICEDMRRETLAALVETVSGLGFILAGDPYFTDDGGVRILARRPNGQECSFVVRLDGGMRYAFENFEGKACRKDRDDVLARLRDAYGIDFSDERVLWENPDEVGKDHFGDGTGTESKGGF